MHFQDQIIQRIIPDLTNQILRIGRWGKSWRRMVLIWRRIYKGLVLVFLWGVPSSLVVSGDGFRHGFDWLPEEVSASESGWRLDKNAFGRREFLSPVHIKSPVDQEGIVYVLQRAGRITRLNTLTDTSNTFLDIRDRVSSLGEGGLLGIAFHPDFNANRQFYIVYTTNLSAPPGLEFYSRLSRFTANETHGLLQAAPESEMILISQRDEFTTHNAGEVAFGPDGYLYVGLGDEGNDNDLLGNAQKLDGDFFSGIIRIDVDQNPSNFLPNRHPAIHGHFRVPADNPFVGLTEYRGVPLDPDKVRTEFWAIGFRNPFRFSFDASTGHMWLGDVGQVTEEEVNRVRAGGNYGWSLWEGFSRGPRFRENGFQYDFPVYSYGRGTGPYQGASITGGIVYRGNKYPELFGRYLFSDFISGNVWALDTDNPTATPINLIRGVRNLTGFEVEKSTGDILAARLTHNKIYRLTRDPTIQRFTPPARLSEFGLELTDKDSGELTGDGFLKYQVVHPFWSDGASKSRLISLPPGSAHINLNDPPSYPTGTVWVKNFYFPGAKPEMVESRVLIKTHDHVYGFTYKWNQEQSDAELVGEEGDSMVVVIPSMNPENPEDAEGSDGSDVKKVTWRFPGRAACLHCHSKATGGVLGFTRHQLDVVSNGSFGNQLEAFAKAGIIELGSDWGKTMLVPPDASQSSLHARAVSYLHVNCSPCHQPGGTAIGNLDLRITTPFWLKNLTRSRAIDGKFPPVQPGHADQSSIIERMAMDRPGRMPPVGVHTTDVAGLNLLGNWITEELSGWEVPEMGWESWHEKYQMDLPGDGLGASDTDSDTHPDLLEYLLGTDPTNPASRWVPDITVSEDSTFTLSIPDDTLKSGISLRIRSSHSIPGPWSDEVSRPLTPGDRFDFELPGFLHNSTASRFFQYSLEPPL